MSFDLMLDEIISAPFSYPSGPALQAPSPEELEVSGLSPEQTAVASLLYQGRNLCVTGNAGTGKSHLLNWLRQRDRNLHVTASTGIAAIQIAGSTLHSWAGIGLGTMTAGEVVSKLEDKQRRWGDGTLSRMRSASTLIVDEISMVSGETLILVDQVLRLARRKLEAPFGGLQVAFFGDFLQLPPVARPPARGSFAFEAPVWTEAQIQVCFLTKTFRQADQRFADVLHKIRLDQLDESVEDFLRSRWNVVDPDPSRPPLVLHTHNKNCALLNLAALAEIPGEAVLFPADDWAAGKNEHLLRELDNTCLAPKEFRVKPGARVMLLVNLDLFRGLANGSMGVVTGFGDTVDEKGRKVRSIEVAFDNGERESVIPQEWQILRGEKEKVAQRRQYPLRLASAITVHKSQGMSLDKVQVHLGQVFEAGQSYVALSRAKSPEGLFIVGNDIDIHAHPKALEFYRQAWERREEV